MVGGEKPRQLKHSSTAPLNDLPSGKLQRDFHGREDFFLVKSGLGTRLTK